MRKADAERALKAAKALLKKDPGFASGLFRLPGFPGVWTDGRTWVVDADGGQDWKVGQDGQLHPARWPE